MEIRENTNKTMEAIQGTLEAVKEHLPTTKFENGDRVMINTDHIFERENDESLNVHYKEFIEGNRDTVFTAEVYRASCSGFQLIMLQEEPEWLFCGDDLILYERAEEEEAS